MRPKGKAFWENIWYCLTPVEQLGGNGCQEWGVDAKRERGSKRAIYRPSSPKAKKSRAFMLLSVRQIEPFRLNGRPPSISFCLSRFLACVDISRLWRPRGASSGSSSLLTAPFGCCVSWAFMALLRRLTRPTRGDRQNPPVSPVAALERNWPRLRRRPKRRSPPSGGSAGPVLAAWLRCSVLPGVLAPWLAYALPGTVGAAPLDPADFEALARSCAPAVPVATLVAVARTESGLDPWALHDNTTGVTKEPARQDQALSDAEAWIGRGDSVDVGLMQVNSANFNALGLTARTALDPCISLAGGAAVLQAAYDGGQTTADQQVALLIALSRYNTGSPLKGIMNGYARAVMANLYADKLPALAAQNPVAVIAVWTDPHAPPAWDISATGTYAEAHGAPWIVSLPSPSGIAKQSQGQPVPMAANRPVIADVVAMPLTQATTRSP
jgi:type IV secretion system protein VirB1